MLLRIGSTYPYAYSALSGLQQGTAMKGLHALSLDITHCKIEIKTSFSRSDGADSFANQLSYQKMLDLYQYEIRNEIRDFKTLRQSRRLCPTGVIFEDKFLNDFVKPNLKTECDSQHNNINITNLKSR